MVLKYNDRCPKCNSLVMYSRQKKRVVHYTTGNVDCEGVMSNVSVKG